MEKILPISLKLNFTPTTLGCCGLKSTNLATGISIDLFSVPHSDVKDSKKVDRYIVIDSKNSGFGDDTKQEIGNATLKS